ncbi:MAG: Smr/MutS family protein [Alistipes sp.]|nr:Smr/MutS family protein [Candidatus Alistipes equi]
MVYPTNIEEVLSVQVIRDEIASMMDSNPARELFLGWEFTSSQEEISRRMGLVKQMSSLLLEQGVPSHEVVDATLSLEKLSIDGAFMDVDEAMWLIADLRFACDMKEFIEGRSAERYPLLNKLTSKLLTLYPILSESVRIFDPKHGVRDYASEELYRIRRELQRSEGTASKRLQALLAEAKRNGVVEQDATLSIRDGRPVIPINASNKRKLQGFIHDESSTGKTVYIEPIEVVEINNRIREMELAERREVVRILTAFSAYVRPFLEDVKRSVEFVYNVDMLRSIARWATENSAVTPILIDSSKEPLRMNLRRAVHPILAKKLRGTGKRVVPLSMELDPVNRILVVSGPNAGGKSVALKTVGMLQYMFQCGLPVTAMENSEFPVFESIHLDIGDQQSIENDLSTYSSHLRNMKVLLEKASRNTLFLLDEFGSGTEPQIGAAIAEAILEKLLERKSYGVVTTHFANIKYFASAHDGVQNASMSFDTSTITPLFEMEMGRPGSSFAIEIARKIGLPENIIQCAREKVGSSQVDIEKQLREIARDKRYWEQKREKIRQTDKHVEELEQKYAESLRTIQEERSKILKQAKEQASQMLQEANRKIENTIKDIREAQAEKETTRLLRQDFETFRSDVTQKENDETSQSVRNEMNKIERRLERREERRQKSIGASLEQEKTQPAPKQTLPLVVGSKVRMMGQNGVGVVHDIRGKKATVSFGQIITKIDLSRLEVISSQEFRNATRENRRTTVISADIAERRLNFSSELDVRGERVADALLKVQALLDDALMIGVSSLSILHGKGTGALKQEIRRYLRSNTSVLSIEDDHPDRGGAGITIVKLG